MQAIILAAGQGKRMRPLTENIPKPMLKIKGRPILEYTLTNLPEEISDIFLIIGYKGEMIEEFISRYKSAGARGYAQGSCQRNITCIYQKELNGTAGAIFQIKDLLENNFIVLNGDDLYRKSDIKKLIGCELGMLVKESEQPERFGVLEINDQGDLVRIIEKPSEYIGNLVNIGVYALNKKIFNYEPVAVKILNNEFGLPHTMVKMAADYPVKIVKADFWHPIGFPKDIKKAEEIIHLFV